MEKTLVDRTLDIIAAGGHIYLKDKKGWYMHAWTNLAAGPDQAVFGKKRTALEFFSLEIAFAMCKPYNCKVVVVYPKKKCPTCHK